MACEKQIKQLAITDHDTTAGYEQVIDYAKERKLALISGVEISALWQGRTVHIVGLNVNVDHQGLQDLLQHIRGLRWQRIEQINAKLMKKNHACIMQRMKELVGDGVAGRPHVAQVLFERQRVSSISQAFDRFLTQGRPAYVSPQWPELQDVVKQITSAGGVAVVAHPGQYKLTSRKLNLMLQDFANAGGTGLEVVTSPNRTSEMIGMVDRAKRYGFYASAGSDFHNPLHRWRGLGWLSDWPDNVVPVYQAWQTND